MQASSMAKLNQLPKVLAILIATMLTFPLMLLPSAAAIVSCPQMALTVKSCIGYARNGGELPPQCCNGVRYLNATLTTGQDQTLACLCMRAMMLVIPGLKTSLVEEILHQCNGNPGFAITKMMNCFK